MAQIDLLIACRIFIADNKYVIISYSIKWNYNVFAKWLSVLIGCKEPFFIRRLLILLREKIMKSEYKWCEFLNLTEANI